MRIFLFCILAFLSSLTLHAQHDTTRVLFIGNSFTYTYDVPALVKGLATGAGFPLLYTMHAPPGISVGDTDQGTSAHMFNPLVFDLIRRGKWDFVVLQDNQGRFVYGKKKFPSAAVSKVIEGHFKIRDSVAAYNPCAKMLWFAGWAFKDGYPGIAATGKELIDNINENYTYLKDTAGGILSPIGIAWTRAMTLLPAVNLWGPDDAHQSLAGSYLTASVLFTAIFRTNPERINYTGGIDSITAATLRRIAYQTVIDSMTTNNLAAHTPTLSRSGTLLTAQPGFATYQWFANDTLISSGTANTLTATVNGCYQVVVTGSDGCKERSGEQCINTLSANATTLSGISNIYPVPATSILSVGLPESAPLPAYLTITDATGRKMKETTMSTNRTTLSVADLVPGFYFILIQTSEGAYRTRMQKVD